MEISLKEVEVTKLNLQPGDTLAITIKNDYVTGKDIRDLKEHFSTVFKGNKVIILSVGSNDDIKYSVVSESQNLGCGAQSYCADCNCGKKEQVEGK